MRDSYGRRIDYMRLSITERCNLRCQYCVPRDIQKEVKQLRPFSQEEYLRICRCAVSLGIRKFKVTGGEPLVRQDCLELLERLKAMPGVEAVTITTNGTLLKDCLERLQAMKIDGINVSLDTLRAERFPLIAGLYNSEEEAGKHLFHQVWAAIWAAVHLGLPLKLNCVPLRGVNDDEILDFVELTREKPVDVRFIELMPIGCGRKYEGLSSSELREMIAGKYPDFQPVTEKRGNGPAVYGKIPGAPGYIGFIDAIHGKFCSRCNRIRLTSDGMVKPCLYYRRGIDLRELLQRGGSDEELTEALAAAVLQKPECHKFYETETEDVAEKKNMSEIGG